MEKILNYIGGELRAPQSGKYLENYNPSRGRVYSLIPDSDEKDVDDAVRAAQRAFPAWSQLSSVDRGNHLRNVAKIIRDNVEGLAQAETIDNGKPISLCKSVDMVRAYQNLEFFAETVTQLIGETFVTNAKITNYVTYSPLGVVGCISPWNLPLYLLTWKIAPALVAGNTVIAKPSEVTPMTAFLLSKIAIEAGLPPGVLNIVHGLGPKVGAPLVSHPDIKAISFTGSTATGRSIANSTAGSFKKVSLEMGGKNANIIFADAEFEKSVETTVRSSFLNQGQICLCGSRIFVEKSIYNKFRDALVEKTKQLRQGDPLDPKTDQGALVSEVHMKKVLSFIDLAKSEGGTILCGGERAQFEGDISKGYFVKPTLIENLPFDSLVNQEEIFGPVAVLIPFETENQLLEMVNSTKYGLTASVWTKDLSRAHRVSQNIHVGVVWVNTWMIRDLRTPFGGVKESGVGREGGLYGLKFFSEIKNVCIEY